MSTESIVHGPSTKIDVCRDFYQIERKDFTDADVLDNNWPEPENSGPENMAQNEDLFANLIPK